MRFPTALGFVLLAAYAGCLLAPLAADAQPAKDRTDDAKRLEGTWKVVALEADGRQAPPEELKGGSWSIKGSEVQFTEPRQKPAGKAAVKLDPAKDPKHIDLVGLDGPQKGKKIQGIYKFEKNRLVICLRGPEAPEKGRPKKFMTEADSGLGMITLERVKE
jgi:uncharacterized protein (TIGR03067 family)